MDFIAEIVTRGEGNDEYTNQEKVKLNIAFGLVVAWVILLFTLVRFFAYERRQVVQISLGKAEWGERAHQSMTKYRDMSLELNIPEEELAGVSRAAILQHLSDSGQDEALQAIMEQQSSHRDHRTVEAPDADASMGWIPIK